MPKARYTRDKERGGYRFNFRQANGKYTTLRAATVPEMDNLIRQKTKERDEASARQPDDLTVAQAAALWLPSALDGRSASAQNSIKAALRYVLTQIGDKPLQKVLPADVDRMLLECPGQSNSARNNTLSAARHIFQWAVENGYAERNPTQGKKAGGRKPPEEKPLTKAQQDELLEAVSGTRLYLFVLICLRTGLRHGEALGLKWSDVDFRRHTITVSGIIHRESKMKLDYAAVTKTESGRRTIPMPSDLEAALRDARKDSASQFVISDEDGNHLNQERVYSRWKKLRLSFPCHPHQLRHTYITELCAKSAEVGLDIKTIQYLAGHSTPSITLKIYTHVRASQSEDTARKVREIFG
jgi:integrase